MSVKSARLQRVVMGDNAVLRHVLVRPAVVGNNESLELVPVDPADVIRAFYEQAEGSTVFSIVGAAVSGSTFDFTLSQAQTALLIPGLGQTVRIEITRNATSAKETYYLYRELDVMARGFPSQPQDLDLP